MKILIASSIHKDAMQALQQEHDVISAINATEEQLLQIVPDREVIIFRSGVQITGEVMSHAPDLKLLLRAGSGVDNIDLDYLSNRTNIALVRIPGPGAKAVAELTFTFLLALSRNLLQADKLMRKGRFAKHELTGYLLTGKTMGIIGLGNIGSHVANLAHAWNMRVVGCVEFPTPSRTESFKQRNIDLMECEDVLLCADFISIHVPLKPSTRHLIDDQALSLVQPSAILANLARGGVVDEAALLAALQENRLRGAALDVHESEGDGEISPLAGLSNVILTPHIGAGTYDSQREIGELILHTVSEFMAKGVSDSMVQVPVSSRG